MKRIFINTLILMAAVLMLTFVARYLLTGGLVTTTLKESSSLAYAVSESLILSGVNEALPQINKDYKLEDVRYFENNTWVVANVVPVKSNSDTVTVILKKVDGLYQPALAPANVFSTSYMYTLPSPVAQYLYQKGQLNG